MTIRELEKRLKKEKIDVSRRTIHFYIKEGILPPPEGQGGGARYSEEHVLRLKLIRKLQSTHLKLSGIKEALENMSIEKMQELLRETPRKQPKLDVNTLDNWLHAGPVEFEMKSLKEEIENSEAVFPNEISFLDLREDRDIRPRHSKTRGRGHILGKVTRTTTMHRETWQRISITEGVELNIRQDILHGRRKVIDQVLREIREKLDR